jgi:hypothetical protein
MAMTEEEKKQRRLKRFKSAHPGGRYPKNVIQVTSEEVKDKKVHPFVSIIDDQPEYELKGKKELSPTEKESAPLDLTRPQPREEKPLFDKIDKIMRAAVKSGDAEKATGINLDKNTKNKVQKILKDPVKIEKAIQKTDVAIKSGEAPKKNKGSMADVFTGALFKSMPLLIGSVLGGLDVGIAAQEGAMAAEEGARKAGLQEREMSAKEEEVALKEAQLEQQQKQFEQDQHFKRLQLMQKVRGEELASMSDAKERFVGSKLFGNYTALGDAKAAQTLRDNVTNVENTIDGLNRIMSLSENITLLDRDRRAATEQEIAKIVGKLRIPITGPGAFTDSERDFIKDMIGDPTKISSLESTERFKLEQLVNSSMSDMRNTLQNNTVEGKAQLEAYQKLKQRGYTDEQIQEKLNGR